MSVTRPTLAATLAASTLATAIGTTAVPAAGDEPPQVERCATYALTVEEVEAGAVSEIECWWEDEGSPYGARAILMMVHWDGTWGTGPSLDVYGSGCTGLATNLSGTSWDNRISSTTHISCGNAKHYTGVFGGSNQLTQGPFGMIVNMNGTLNNAVTSVEYAP